jgi:hypothetical protein
MLSVNVIRQRAKKSAEMMVATLVLLLLSIAVSSQTSSAKKRSRNHKPRVKLSVSAPDVTIRCPGTSTYTGGRDVVELLASATDVDRDDLQYSFSVTGGRIIGAGAQVRWVLEGVEEGRYRATVRVSDGRGGVSASSAYVEAGCDALYMCPSVVISCPLKEIEEGQPVTFKADVQGGDSRVKPVYKWRISAGKIISGQGSPVITVGTIGVGNKGVTATVVIGGYRSYCDKTASGGVKTHR